MNLTDWKKTPIQTALAASTVHLWKADLDQFVDFIPSVICMLSRDEVERANRFYFAHDRRRFIVARALLRLLLGRYLQTAPGAITFSYNEYGKPAVEAETGWRFNVSHSANMALFGFSAQNELGVDIEQMRADFATRDIAARFFAPDEVQALARVPDEDKTICFYNCWTRKEAYIKAKGKGLAIPLESFSVNMFIESSSRLCFSRQYPQDAETFSIHPLEVDNAFRAAFAINRREYTTSFSEITPASLRQYKDVDLFTA